MLNPFYWYSLIWTLVLGLYSLGFSEINQRLSTNLMVFFILTILISVVIGFVFREVFQYRSLNDPPKITNTITFIIAIFIAIDLVYTGQIPFFTILKGVGKYGDTEVMGMPLVHTLLTNLIVVYSSYLFYIFLETKEKSILIKIFIQLSFFLLFFQKGMIIMILFIFFNLFLAKLRKYHKVFTIKNMLIMIFGISLLLYLNGGLANIRSGMTWNDSSYIMSVAHINNWPKWIAGQYIWSYTYITTPLGNLNQLLLVFNNKFDIGKLILTIVPVILSNQFMPIANGFNTLDYKLAVRYLNASTGFMDAVDAAGFLGICLFYVMVLCITIFLTWYIFKKKKNYSTPMFAIIVMMVMMLFFYDTFNAAATSLIPIILFLLCSLKRISFRGK